MAPAVVVPTTNHNNNNNNGRPLERICLRPGKGNKRKRRCPAYGLAWSKDDDKWPQFLAMTQGNRISVFEHVVAPEDCSTVSSGSSPFFPSSSSSSSSVDPSTNSKQRLVPYLVFEIRPPTLGRKKDILYACVFFEQKNVKLPKLVAGGEKGELYLFSLDEMPTSSAPQPQKSNKPSNQNAVTSAAASFVNINNTTTSANSSIFELEVSPTRNWIVLAAYEDGLCRMWDMNNFCLMAVFTRIQETLNVGLSSLDFHHSGDRLVTASEDNIVCIWHCKTIIDDYLSKNNNNRNKGSTARAASKKNQNNTAMSWRPKCVRLPMFCTSLCRRSTEGLDCIQFFNDLLLTSSMEYICLWYATIQPTTPMLSSGPARVISPSEEGVEILYEFRLDQVKYYYSKFHCSHQTLAAGNGTGQVFLWDLEALIASEEMDNDDDDDDTTMEDENDLSSNSSSSRSIRIGQKSMAPSRILTTNQNITVRNVQFSPNGQDLVATTEDGQLFRWKMW